MTYQFTDTDLAAQRLELLATVYRPATHGFLSQCLPENSRATISEQPSDRIIEWQHRQLVYQRS